ncbi:MAG: hypothetical protein AAFO07_34140, partial [Bacteroidota bacterium]
MKNKIIITVLISLSLIGTGYSQINEVNSPLKNFEELWKEFEYRYANFELKEVNWNKVYEKYKVLVNEKTTNKRLFEICCSMLQELNDGHVTINPNFEEDNIECGPPYEFSLALILNTEKKIREFDSLLDAELTK